ncbi:hypothetical protein [Leisingera sp. S232]|uniref:hypothetical protein n=1 Tax=Leisingera sp. S232 TaxID=3415132 RepID=UPI003C7D1696
MIGVILWSDAPLTKAVIWCDDQGDLAFYANKTGADFQGLSPGDWVEFDLTLSGNVRTAENLAIVMEQGSPGLADRLYAAACCGEETANNGQERKIVPFPLQAVEKQRAVAPLQVVQV